MGMTKEKEKTEGLHKAYNRRSSIDDIVVFGKQMGPTNEQKSTREKIKPKKTSLDSGGSIYNCLRYESD